MLAWRGVAETVRSTLILLGAQIGVAVLLVISLIVAGDVDLQSAPLDPGSAADGWAGIGLALTYGILAMVGYESAATLAVDVDAVAQALAAGE